MKFFKSIRGTWDTVLKRYVFTNSEEFDYGGTPVYAMGGSGGGGGTETVPTGPWQPQIPYINSLMQEAAGLYRGGAPQYPSTSTVAGQNPMLAGSQQNINQYVQGQQPVNQMMQQSLLNTAANAGQNPMSQVANPMAGQLQGGLNSLLQSGQNPLTAGSLGTQQGANQAINTATAGAGRPVGPMQLSGAPSLQYSAPGLNFNPSGLQQVSGAGVNANPAIQANLSGSGLNPFIDQTINAATRSLTNNFQRNVLPGIGDSASGAGQFGGSKQGVAQGIAAGDYMNTVGDVTNQLYGRGFNANVAAQQQAIGQAQQGQLGQGQLQTQAAGLGLEGLLGQGNIALGAQQAGNQRAGVEVQAGGLQEMMRNNMMNSALQGAQLSQQGLNQGLNYGLQGTSTGTSQVGNLMQSGANNAMQQYFQAMGMAPGIQSNQLAQYGAQNQAGQQLQGANQAQLTDEVNRYFYNMYSPYNALSQYQNFVGGSFGSSVGNPTGSQLYNVLGTPGTPQSPPQYDPRNYGPRMY